MKLVGGIEWVNEPGGDHLEFPIPVDTELARLASWWHRLAHADLEGMLPKAAEYSAHDLELTGDLFSFLAPDSPDEVLPAELTCWFYLASKVMRGIGALKEGREPSEDTLRDIRIYSIMIQRIRDKGSWPGLKTDG